MYDPTDFEKDFDTKDFTDQLFKEKFSQDIIVTAKRTREVMSGYVEPIIYSQDEHKRLVASQENYLFLKTKFIETYGQEFFNYFIKEYITGVYGETSLIAPALYEKPALKDFYKAASIGKIDVIERAIEIGKNYNE